MIKNRTVADNIIKHFDLNAAYEQKYRSATRKVLEDLSNVTAGKDAIIAIAVDDSDPKRSAGIANVHV